MPKWVTTQKFTVLARAAGNVATKDQMRLMMQSLLADRFKLVVHFERPEVPVLALRLDKQGKLGINLHPHAEGPSCDLPVSRHGLAPKPDTNTPQTGSAEFPFVCGRYNLMVESNNMILWGSRDASMATIAQWISVTPPSSLGRPVVDETGLSGTFDFTLEWRIDSAMTSGSGPEPSGPTPEEAVKQQLGLRLVSTKASVSRLVIDHVEMPSDN